MILTTTGPSQKTMSKWFYTMYRSRGKRRALQLVANGRKRQWCRAKAAKVEQKRSSSKVQRLNSSDLHTRSVTWISAIRLIIHCTSRARGCTPRRKGEALIIKTRWVSKRRSRSSWIASSLPSLRARLSTLSNIAISIVSCLRRCSFRLLEFSTRDYHAPRIASGSRSSSGSLITTWTWLWAVLEWIVPYPRWGP